MPSLSRAATVGRADGVAPGSGVPVSRAGRGRLGQVFRRHYLDHDVGDDDAPVATAAGVGNRVGDGGGLAAAHCCQRCY